MNGAANPWVIRYDKMMRGFTTLHPVLSEWSEVVELGSVVQSPWLALKMLAVDTCQPGIKPLLVFILSRAIPIIRWSENR
jgi:hypothetical protein